MGNIANAWASVREEVPEEITLVAVSKTKPVEAVVEAFGAGARMFGENRALEVECKHES